MGFREMLRDYFGHPISDRAFANRVHELCGGVVTPSLSLGGYHVHFTGEGPDDKVEVSAYVFEEPNSIPVAAVQAVGRADFDLCADPADTCAVVRLWLAKAEESKKLDTGSLAQRGLAEDHKLRSSSE